MTTELRERVVIWLLPILRMDEFARSAYERLLTTPERSRGRRFLAQESRDQYLATRALLRRTLTYYTHVPPLTWQFAENVYGRPYIAVPEEFNHVQFNVSHTQGLAACVLSLSYEVGIDVENITRNVDFMNIATAAFAPPEAQDVRRRHPLSRRAFYSYWTLKEAYIKARGKGLSIPLDSFWFDLSVDPPALHCTARCGDEPAQWQFRQIMPTDEHQVAVAIRGAPDQRPDISVHWADKCLASALSTLR